MWIELTQPMGERCLLNAHTITHVWPAKGAVKERSENVGCGISFTDGKVFVYRESYDTVKEKIRVALADPQA